MIRDRKVIVNGLFAEIGMKVNPDFDNIYINGKELKTSNKNSQVLLFNKPKNVITTCSDKHNRTTVFDFLPNQYRKGFYPIGRLDFLSRGALLITNDGKICYELSHPKFEHEKIYLVNLCGNFKDKDITRWREGVILDGKKTKPCEIELVKKNSTNFSLKISLEEGRNRQIRRIASFLGYKVIDLQRISFANIALGNLKEGDWKLIKNEKIGN